MNKYQVTCSFVRRADFDRALGRLFDAGFRSNDISVLFGDENSMEQTGRRTGAEIEDTGTAGAGLGAGAAIGGTLGLLAGIGAFAIPGAGPFLAAGPLASLLAGAGIGAATGGIAGALVDLGLSESEAASFESRANQGEILVSVQCNGEKERDTARSLLEQNGAAAISSRSTAAAAAGTTPAEQHSSLASQITVDRSAVERRAYEIWEREGRADGRSMEYWSRAEQELGIKR